jgi:hypothetical protein
MKDTFDFTSYVRSGRLHEEENNYSGLNPQLLTALQDYRNSVVVVGSGEWYQIADIAQEVLGLSDDDLHYFLGGDFGGPDVWEYAKELGITMKYKEDEEQPHRTSDTGVKPRGIGEVIKEILKSKLTK